MKFIKRLTISQVTNIPTCIYVLWDKRVDQPFYVGKTNSPDFRFKTHLTDKSSSGKKHKAKMREILAEDSDGVEMRIIEETTAAEASYRERFWIDELRKTHNLTNAIIKHATGGM